MDRANQFCDRFFADRLFHTKFNQVYATYGPMWVALQKSWYPQIIHFNRLFHYFHHHPFWVFSPYFWKHPCCCTYTLHQISALNIILQPQNIDHHPISKVLQICTHVYHVLFVSRGKYQRSKLMQIVTIHLLATFVVPLFHVSISWCFTIFFELWKIPSATKVSNLHLHLVVEKSSRKSSGKKRGNRPLEPRHETQHGISNLWNAMFCLREPDVCRIPSMILEHSRDHRFTKTMI